jgi:hypothetical protein
VHSRKAILAFCRLAHRTVRCTTEHCPVQIFFLIWQSRPLQSWSRWRTGHCPVHTGQSGAPSDRWRLPRVARGFRGRPLARPTVGSPDSPVHHRTLSGADFFPSLAKPTVGALEPLAHRTLSGAHRTVRCPRPTVGSAMCLARIARPTVGPVDRWLTGQSGAHRTVR